MLADVGRVAFGHVQPSAQRWPVLVSGHEAGDGEPDGILGNDVLHRYEVDLDLPHAMVRLYQGQPCGTDLPGWSARDAGLPWTRPFKGGWHVAIPVIMQGHDWTALIDSGAASSVIGRQGASALGVPAAELADDLQFRIVGIGPDKVKGRLHRFGPLEVGGQIIPTLDAVVVEHSFRKPEMVLGGDYLTTHKVWISYATRQVHVAHTW